MDIILIGMGCEGFISCMLAREINHHGEILLFEEVRPIDRVAIETSFKDRTFLFEAILNDSCKTELVQKTSQDKLFQFHHLIIPLAGFICRCKGGLGRGPPTTRVYPKPTKSSHVSGLFYFFIWKYFPIFLFS